MKAKKGNTARKSGTSTLGEAMQDLLKTYKIKDKYDQTSLIASWERLMGTPIASRTEQLYIKDKKMFVKLNSAPLKQELSYSKAKILAILREAFHEDIIDDVIFL